MNASHRSPFYTSLWNAVDYTVGVLPVTFVDAEVDKAVPLHAFYSDDDRDIYHLCRPHQFLVTLADLVPR